MSNEVLKNQIEDLKEQHKNIGLAIPERPNGTSNVEYKELLIKSLASAESTNPEQPSTPSQNGNVPVPNIPELHVDSADAKELHEMFNKLQQELEAERAERKEMNKALDTLLKQVQFQGKSQSQLSQDPEFLAIIDRLTRGKTNSSGLIHSDYVRPEDRVEPTTFVAIKHFGPITFRTEAGRDIAPPDGVQKIRFSPKFRWVVNGQRMSYRAVYTTENRLVVEFLQKHEKFGVEIFLDGQDTQALDQNSEWSDIRDAHLTVLRQRHDHEVMQLAREQNPPINFGSDTDINHLRKLVAERLAHADVQLARSLAAKEDERRVGANLLMKGYGLPTQAHAPESLLPTH